MQRWVLIASLLLFLVAVFAWLAREDAAEDPGESEPDGPLDERNYPSHSGSPSESPDD